MSYQNLYSMPCRLPCDRYTGPNDVFEGQAQLTEHYNRSNKKVVVRRPPPKTKKQQQVCSCNCRPVSYVTDPNMYDDNNGIEQVVLNAEPYDYDSRSFSESYEYEPTVDRESYKEESGNCGCAKNNPPYRMETCGYNKSRSWKVKNMVPEVPQNVVQQPEPQSEEATCACFEKNSPYIMENGQYNQSPTWNDQAGFRQNVQNYN